MHNLDVRSGDVFIPNTIGDAMAMDTIQTIAMVSETRVLLLCLAY